MTDAALWHAVVHLAAVASVERSLGVALPVERTAMVDFVDSLGDLAVVVAAVFVADAVVVVAASFAFEPFVVAGKPAVEGCCTAEGVEATSFEERALLVGVAEVAAVAVHDQRVGSELAHGRETPLAA